MESKFIAFSTNHLQIRNATHITVISYNKECTDPVGGLAEDSSYFGVSE